MKEKIKAVLIFEMLGRPAEHLKVTLEQFIDKLSDEAGVEVSNKKIHEPKKLEEAEQELFTTFAEAEINFKDIESLLKVVFIYMPSHIEIMSPKTFQMRNFELGTLMGELARKLHQYDGVAKKLVVERNILLKQLQEMNVRPAIMPIGPSTPPSQPQEEKSEKKKKVNKKKVKKKTKKK
jgi:hypothetical protein